MAEERLIDADKDKKYRIRKNADGEDELYIDESEDEEIEEEEVTFAAPDDGYYGSDESVYTPEQLEVIRLEEEKEKAQKRAELDALIGRARADCEENKFATAVDHLEKAAEIDPCDGEIYALRLVAYTRNFTDYSQILTAEEFCDEVQSYTSAQTKAELFARASVGLEENIGKLRARVAELDAENEKHKAERALKFVSDRNRAIALFCAALAALIVFSGLAVYYSTVIHAVADNGNLIKTIVFAAIAAAVFIAAVFAARGLITACRRVRLNKRNTATKLGRELLSEQARLKAFVAIYNALKE